MGSFLWWFLRDAEGQVSALPVRKAEDFLRGRLAIPSSDGVVRLALVAGPTEDRRALAVRTLQLTKHSVDARGFHDSWPSMVEAMNHMSVLDGLVEKPDRGHNVIAAEETFQMARYRAKAYWKPTPADTAALKAAINRKAGRVILHRGRGK